MCGLFLPALAAGALLSSCAAPPKPISTKNVFIKYWPPAENSGRVRLAVKDNIDVRGVITTAGSKYLLETRRPAKEDAECLAVARERNVEIIGKTNLSEFAVSPSGFNDHFGTPMNPFDRKKKLLPGGSSSGSAVAVASGLADVAFGTDTAGSVRVPAACCGVVGLKTTHGLISLKGIFPVEPKHLDTVGPLGRDIAHTVQGMDLLQRGFAGRYAAASAARVSGADIRIGRLQLKGTDSKIDRAIDQALAKAKFRVVVLDETFRAKWEQAQEDGTTIAAAGAWMSAGGFASKKGVSVRTKAVLLIGRLAYPAKYEKAVARQKEWQKTLRDVFQNVDFIALPTLQTTPPLELPGPSVGLIEARMLSIQNTMAVNFAGNPALALPVPLRRADVPATSLQLIGPRRSEAELLNAGRLVEVAVKKKSRGKTSGAE